MNLSLEQLKDIAIMLSFQHHYNVGVEKLTEQLTKHCEGLGKNFSDVVTEYLKDQSKQEVNTTEVKSSLEEEINRLRKLTFVDVAKEQAKKDEALQIEDATKLIRCMLTCNNKNKTSYFGEVFAVRNAAISEIKKFIPFGVSTHIPQIMFNMIKEKQYQVFRKEKLPTGITVTRSHLVPEYNIQILDPISKEELEAIKKKQLAEGFTGE